MSRKVTNKGAYQNYLAFAGFPNPPLADTEDHYREYMEMTQGQYNSAYQKWLQKQRGWFTGKPRQPTASNLQQFMSIKGLIPKQLASLRRGGPINKPTRKPPTPITDPSQQPQSPITNPSGGIPTASLIGKGGIPTGIPLAQGTAAANQAIGTIANPTQAGNAAQAYFNQIQNPTPSLGTATPFTGSSGIGGQSAGIINSGGNQDLARAIVELNETIKDLIEKLDAQNNRPDSSIKTSQNGNRTVTHKHSSGKDLISQAASGAPGIEWANTVERWFMARFGRR